MLGKFVRAITTPGGAIGFAILVIVLLVALGGPLVAPYDPTTPVDLPSASPSAEYMLGTDFLGRDVLSRMLSGGSSVVTMGVSATVIAYVLALVVGMYAGTVGGWADALIMRAVDVILSFPPMIVLLLLIGGLQSHPWVLVMGVVIVQLPSISRIGRAATLSVAGSSYVEVSRARGDPITRILRRDIFPNVLQTVTADFGIRFGYSIILIASVNYLGLGIQPPASDWGLMISENQAYVGLNPWAVLGPAIMLALITIGVNLFADSYLAGAYLDPGRRKMPKSPDEPAAEVSPAKG